MTGEPLPVLWDRIDQGMKNENRVAFVGLYANVSNVFWEKREGRKEVRTYTSSEPGTIRTHPSRRTHFLPFHRDVPLKCTVSSMFHRWTTTRKRAR